MKIRKSAVLLSLEVLMFGSLVGCWWSGSGNTTPTDIITQGQSGKVTQGAVSGGTVWADNLATGTRFVIDSAEQSTKTTTSATGTFTLPVQPSYKYVIVSQGGTDTITGRPATTMLAPAGAKSVSALTTIVALDTSGKLAAIINGLLPTGKSFDDDITSTGGLTPAAMVAINSIELAVTTLNETIGKAATTSGATLSQQQKDNIDLTAYSNIATQLSSLTSASLSNTQSLAGSIQTAVASTLTTVAANNTNITFQNTATIASSIANNSVATSANVVGNATGNAALQNVTTSNVQSAPVTVTTSGVITEATVMASGTNTQIVNTAVTTVSTADASSVTTTSTPTTYAPPVIAVANNPTITGYELAVNASGSTWNVSTLTVTFSDDMIATASGSSSFANSVLNPANYLFTQTGCSPASYSAKVVTFTCGSLSPGTFGITVNKATSTSGVWASTGSLGLLVDNTKTFTLPTVTGSTGGSSLDMF